MHSILKKENITYTFKKLVFPNFVLLIIFKCINDFKYLLNYDCRTNHLYKGKKHLFIRMNTSGIFQ